MPSFALMIRGLNVGGSKPMRMQVLRELLSGLGLKSVRTYLQSGNAVYEAPDRVGRASAKAAERAIRAEFGYEVTAIARTAAEMKAVVAANPFAGRAGADPRFLHVTFLAGLPARQPAVSELPAAPGERVAFSGEAVYLYCPLGYGNSRLTNNYLERALGCRATTRNWNTVRALEAMALGREPQAAP
ncbi:MAG TPA: DUF1697 domain-containing protein [Opitutaceae bacterium]